MEKQEFEILSAWLQSCICRNGLKALNGTAAFFFFFFNLATVTVKSMYGFNQHVVFLSLTLNLRIQHSSRHVWYNPEKNFRRKKILFVYGFCFIALVLFLKDATTETLKSQASSEISNTLKASKLCIFFHMLTYMRIYWWDQDHGLNS